MGRLLDLTSTRPTAASRSSIRTWTSLAAQAIFLILPLEHPFLLSSNGFRIARIQSVGTANSRAAKHGNCGFKKRRAEHPCINKILKVINILLQPIAKNIRNLFYSKDNK